MVNGRGEGVCHPLEAASGFVLPDSGGPECHVLGAIVASRWDRWRLPPAVVHSEHTPQVLNPVQGLLGGNLTPSSH